MHNNLVQQQQQHPPLNQSKSLSLSVTPTAEDFRHSSALPFASRTFLNNRHRFSLKNINTNYNINSDEKCSVTNVTGSNNKGIYSEPLDSINFIRNKIDTNSTDGRTINNRWSQPAIAHSYLKNETKTRGAQKFKKHYFKSTDNLNRLAEMEISDENITC